MDLRKRLARLDQLNRRPRPDQEPAPPTDVAAVREQLGLAGDEVWQREDERPEVPCPAGPVPSLDGYLTTGTPADLRWQDILFLDTETTGLAGGTGTLVFLVGLAWWDADGCFRVRQLFLPGPGREAPLLRAVEQLAADHRVVATYNGAAFDLPLLRTRARMNRREDPVQGLIGWDLLVAARRCWGRRLPDCRQQTVEVSICGRARGEGDIDGALIPATYQDFLHGASLGALPRVLRHNRRDMDGMALVLSAVADEARGLESLASPSGCWQDAWSRGLVCERRRATAAAAGWVAGLDPAQVDEPRAVLDAVRLLKRVADWVAVEQMVLAGLRRWPEHPQLHYEAAVLYEHRLADPVRALPHARALADPRRLERLRAKLLRHGA